MAVTNDQINAWLQSNAGASDADIAAAMNQYGVTTEQMAQATGLGQDVVQSRYNAALAPLNAQNVANTPATGIANALVDGRVPYSPSATRDRSRALFDLDDLRSAAFGSAKANIDNPELAGSYTFEDFNRDNPIEQMLEYQLIQNGVYAPFSLTTPEQRRQAFVDIYGEDAAKRMFDAKPLYEGLTKTSTAKEIADAYQQFQQRSGGDTAANQQQAIDYLTGLGFGEPAIEQAYERFQNQSPALVETALEQLTRLQPEVVKNFTPEERAIFAKAPAMPISPRTGQPGTPFNSISNVTADARDKIKADDIVKGFVDWYGSDNASEKNQLEAISKLRGLGVKEYLLESVFPAVYDVSVGKKSAGSIEAAPLYKGLNAQSTPEGIAAAYQQFIRGAGGNTQANQQQAIDYLTGLGISQPAINDAYKLYQTPEVTQDATQAATGPVFDPKLGVFQKVYDPRTGQEFISPAQAFAAGVTDYTTEMPMKLDFLNETSKKAVTDAMAGGLTFDQALNRLGGQFGMSGKEFYNAEVQGGVGYKYTPFQFTGYSDPLNKFLSGMQENTPNFQYTPDFALMQKSLMENPEIATAIEDIYKLDPKHQLFTGSAGNLLPTIQRLAASIEEYGKPAALQNFYKQQQNLVGFGGDNWFGGQNMGNPQWAELQRKIMDLTPVASDDKWDNMVRRTSGNRQVDGIMRDPTSNRGVGLLINERTGRPDGVAYYDKDGRMLNTSTFNKEDVYENLEKYGFDLSHVGDFGRFMTSRGVGGDMRGVTEDLSEMATPEWVDAQIKHLNWQNSVADGAEMSPPASVTQARIEKIRQTNEMAKRILSGGAGRSKAVDTNTPENLLYAGLTENSTPEDIAAAYQQFTQNAGGDTQANQQRAIDYLTKTVGASESDIAKAYGLYQDNAVDPYAFAYQYGQQNDDFSGLMALLNQTPNPKELISKYKLTPEQINEIEFGTGFDLDQSGAFGAGQTKSDWDYNKFYDAMNDGSTDTKYLSSLLDPLRTQDPMLAKNAKNIFDEMIAQQSVTGGGWSGGKLGSKESAALDYALKLAERGLTSLNDIGTRVAEDPTGEMPPSVQIFNKKTGDVIGADGGISGLGGNKLNYAMQFAEDGTPIPFTIPRSSSWVQFREGALKPIASMIAMANPALMPYVAGGNALNAASKGDWGSAIVSGLTAAVGFSGDLGLSASTVANLNQARTGAQILNAIDKGNPLQIANALMQTDTGKGLMGMDMGGGVTLGNVLNTARVAASVNAGDYAGAANYAGALLNNPDLRVAGSSLALVNALKSGDPFKIITAMSQLDKSVKTATKDSGSITKKLSDAGLEERELPAGIQVASADGEIPFRAEVSAAPIFAEDPRAANIRPPAGYRVLSRSEQEERLISQGSGDLPSKYETIRPTGSYYDRTLNAWLAPSGEFEAVTNVEDFSKYFENTNLSDKDVADIYRGVQTGGVTAEDLYWLTGKPNEPISSDEIQRLVSGVRGSGGQATAGSGGQPASSGREPTTYMGEIVIPAKRPVIELPFEEQADSKEAPKPRNLTAKTPAPEPVKPVEVAPKTTPKPTKPAPAATPKAPAPSAPPKVVQEVAKQLGVPATSQIAIDITEALYGTMEYFDPFGDPLADRKMRPAATQKQRQQTKMAQGGYLDAALAEEMSVDELLNLLR